MKQRLTLALLLGATLLISGCGSRSVGNKIDDQFIPSNVSSNIERAHADLGSKSSHIVVTSYNGVVLLAGQTPRADLKQLAGQAAGRTQDVKKVYNELQVMTPSNALARSNDALITSKIKANMLLDTTIPSSKIKIVTENGIVFLLGLVTRKEGQSAANVATTHSGVQKVVKLFEYVD